jgi:hypothetical protein
MKLQKPGYQDQTQLTLRIWGFQGESTKPESGGSIRRAVLSRRRRRVKSICRSAFFVMLSGVAVLTLITDQIAMAQSGWTARESNRLWTWCCFIGGRNKAGGGGSWRADLYIDRQRRDVDSAGEQSELVRCCFIGGRNKAGGGGRWRADLYIDRQRRDVDTAGEQSELARCCFIGGRNKAGGGGRWRADLYIDRQRRDVDTAGRAIGTGPVLLHRRTEQSWWRW